MIIKNILKPVAFMKASILASTLFLIATPISFGESSAYVTHPYKMVKAGISLQSSDYLLGPGDELQFQVLGEPEYTVDKVVVQPDGKVSLPGAGLLDVGNLSVAEVIDMAQLRLSRTIKNPQVSLSLLRPRAAIVYLAGAVMRPGMFQINTSDTQQSGLTMSGSEPVARVDFRLSNILTVAGGVTMHADLTQVAIHHVNGDQTVIVDLWKVLKGTDTSQDILISSGDTVFIPTVPAITLNDQDFETLLRSSIGPKSFPVRILGQANQPGTYQIDGTSPFLNTAIAKAGGFAPQASQNAVAIRRFSDENKFTDMFISPEKFDFYLRPNDVIVIGENKVYKSGRFMRQVAEILSPLQSVAMTASYSSQVFAIGGWSMKRFGATK